MQYRPFWFSLFHPRLTGGIIAVAVFLALQMVANLFGLVATFGQQNFSGAALHLVAAALFGLPAYGLLKLNRRARLIAIVVCLLMMVQGGIAMLFISLFEGMLTVVLYGLAAIYLLSEKCRKVFFPPEENDKEAKDQS